MFTIPKRLRLYFRYDRSLLGKLCKAAYETVAEVFKLEIDGDSGVAAMIGAVQTHGDLLNWNPHIHAIVAEGVFTQSGHFVHIPDIWKHRAHDIWQDKVFDLLLDQYKIDEEVVAGMKLWKHSGFSVDNSVRLEADDAVGMQRLAEYISRCPFSLGRMISGNADGSIVYRSTKGKCLPFPLTGDDGRMKKGIPRNFQMYEPLEFLAEVTQHIPNKGEHQVRYYGFYSNKKRGMLRKQQKGKTQNLPGLPGSDTPASRKFRMTWAALIKCVYEVDPLKCPKCGGAMKIVSCIDQEEVIEAILKHCGKWKEAAPRPPPKTPEQLPFGEPLVDYGFFDSLCN